MEASISLYELNRSMIKQQGPLEEKDICVLLGNLLDNAIEASETVKNHDAWIRVKLEKAGYLFFIEISNSCEKVPEIIDGEILTTKREKEFHGYGLKSVKRIRE